MVSFWGFFHKTRKGSNFDLRISVESRQEITPEDILPDLSTQFAQGLELEKKLEIPVPHLIIFIFFILVFSSIFFLASYSFVLSVIRNDEYKDLALRNSQQVYPIYPPRGDIVSSDGQIIATSQTLFNLILNPSKLPNGSAEIFSQTLVDHFPKVSYEFILGKVTSSVDKNLRELVLLKNLSEDEINSLAEFLNSYPSLSLREDPTRVYEYGSLFSHIIGYTASITDEELKNYPEYSISDSIGKAGLEYYFEEYLSGNKGLFAKIITSLGDTSHEKLLKQPERGMQIELSIDAGLQKASYDALSRGLRENNLRRGALVALDPNSGKVLSMISLPDFDPNDFTQGLTGAQADAYFNNTSQPLFNRAIAGEYPTASTIKPLIASAALEEDIIDPKKYIYTEGFISVPSIYDPSIVYTFLDWKNHGYVDMKEAIAMSSNVYFYTIGGGYKGQEGLGIDTIKKYLLEFGLGRVLGINFGSESAGLIPSPEWKRNAKGEEWKIGDTYNVSIGQGDILATPLQVASATSVFANGGIIYRPYVVENLSVGYQVVRKYSPFVINSNFLSDRTINTVSDGMREAVVSGSSIYLSQLTQPVAGKTGTAQAPRDTAHAWFTGFGPYENPNIVLTVLLEEGEKSSNAVHVAHDIFKWYFENRPQ